MSRENELIARATEALRCDFDIALEVSGFHLIQRNRVRIDMLCWPKQHLIEAGFVGDSVGIEFKIIDQRKAHQGGLNRLLWQAITYGQSEFIHNSTTYRPAFVLICFNQHELVDIALYKSLLCFCEHANIGELLICRDGYIMRSYGRTVWSNRNGKIYRSNVSTILTNRKIGSI